jgi:hypothetical protein
VVKLLKPDVYVFLVKLLKPVLFPLRGVDSKLGVLACIIVILAIYFMVQIVSNFNPCHGG